MEKLLLLAVGILAVLTGTRAAVPNYAGDPYSASVDENVAADTDVITITVNIASDFSLSGAHSSYFTLSATSSVTSTILRTSASGVFDAEGTATLTPVVTAADASNAAQTRDTTVTVTVNNVNEAPTSTCSHAVLLAVGSDSTTTVLTAAATDPESNTITYAFGTTMVDTSNSPIVNNKPMVTVRAHTDKFSIDGSSGVVSILSGVTLDTSGAVYFLDVLASDNQTPALTGTVYMAVCVGSSIADCGSDAAMLSAVVSTFILAIMLQIA